MRVKDIPIFIIAAAILLPLMDAFIKLVERGTINIHGIPDWLGFAAFIVVIALITWIASAIWKRILEFLQRNRT